MGLGGFFVVHPKKYKHGLHKDYAIMLQALEEQIQEEVIRDLERIDLHKTRASMLEDQVIPLRQKALDYTNKWVNAMQLNRLFLLEAQKGLMRTHLDLLQTQMELQRALVDLERHLGGSLP